MDSEAWGRMWVLLRLTGSPVFQVPRQRCQAGHVCGRVGLCGDALSTAVEGQRGITDIREDLARPAQPFRLLLRVASVQGPTCSVPRFPS